MSAGRLVPSDLYGDGPKAWRNLRYPRSEIPADATRAHRRRGPVADVGDWVAVTPPRVPELRTLQQYLGSTQPMLVDWTVGLVFPCQHPMLHVDGVTEVPKYRISPDYPAKAEIPTRGRRAATAGCSASPTSCCAPT